MLCISGTGTNSLSSLLANPYFRNFVLLPLLSNNYLHSPSHVLQYSRFCHDVRNTVYCVDLKFSMKRMKAFECHEIWYSRDKFSIGMYPMVSYRYYER